MFAYAAVLPVLRGWTCARGVMGWRMVRGEGVGNGVDQHHITNGVNSRPWNHEERSWGMCLRMCRRAACAARALLYLNPQKVVIVGASVHIGEAPRGHLALGLVGDII